MDKGQVEHEHKALIERILRSPRFAKSEDGKKLLRILFSMRELTTGLDQDVLSLKMYGWDEAGVDKIGRACQEVRTRLREYMSSEQGMGEKWCCDFPPGSPKAGHRLDIFINPRRAPSSTEVFWSGHIGAEGKVSVIYDAPIFYIDENEHFAFRYFDINSQHDAEALMALKEMHNERYEPTLRVERFYLALGEVEARDRVAEWFSRFTDIIVDTYIGARMSVNDLGGCSPILIGSTHRNPLITQVLGRRSSRHLGFDYRIGTDIDRTLGRAKIRDVTSDEISRLPEGTFAVNGADCIVLDNLIEGYVFGLVTRLPNPFGSGGGITIINSDYARAIHELAKAVTSDEPCSELIQEVIGDDGQLAVSFEALYLVDLGQNKAAPGRAQLIACRRYESGITI
jgi:hypothetical protein